MSTIEAILVGSEWVKDDASKTRDSPKILRKCDTLILWSICVTLKFSEQSEAD